MTHVATMRPCSRICPAATPIPSALVELSREDRQLGAGPRPPRKMSPRCTESARTSSGFVRSSIERAQADGELAHRLDLEYAGVDGRSGKVPREDGIVRMNSPASRDRALRRVERGDAIDEAERIAVREEPLDRGAIELQHARRVRARPEAMLARTPGDVDERRVKLHGGSPARARRDLRAGRPSRSARFESTSA